MKHLGFKRIFPSLLLLSLILSFSISSLAVNHDVRVKLSSFKKLPRISARTLQVAMPGRSFEKLGARFVQLTKHPLSLEKSFGWWNGEGRVWPSPTLYLKGENVLVGSNPAPKRFKIHAHSRGVDWIGIFPVEEYLKGVIGSEMPASYPMEALKAQVIAARTYALKRKTLRKREVFDLESTIMDQVFTWPQKNLPAWAQKKIEKAVDETRGQVLVGTKSRRLIHAFYHADCGGSTESAYEVWQRGKPSSSRHKDHACQARSSNQWRTRLSESQLLAGLKKHYFVGLNTKIENVRITERTPSGRAKRMSFTLSHGRSIEMSGEGMRRIFGFSRVKSTLMDMKYSDKEKRLVVHGKGHGHGVGLCQKGARSHALQGKSASSILKLYYPFAQIQRLKVAEPERLAAAQ